MFIVLNNLLNLYSISMSFKLGTVSFFLPEFLSENGFKFKQFNVDEWKSRMVFSSKPRQVCNLTFLRVGNPSAASEAVFFQLVALCRSKKFSISQQLSNVLSLSSRERDSSQRNLSNTSRYANLGWLQSVALFASLSIKST